MAGNRPTITAAFLAIFGIGAAAVAIVALAVAFTSSSAQRIDDARRDAAAVDLLEQRHVVASLLAAEEAAVVIDQVGTGDAMVSAPFTAQRATAVENAQDLVQEIADRTDSVGDEARRWLAALEMAQQPQEIADPLERLIAYDDLVAAARDGGIVASDQHHTSTLRRLETAALTPASLWEFFYVATAVDGQTPPPLPPAVDRFLQHRNTATRLPPDAELPSDRLAATDMATLAILGVSQESINTILAGDQMAAIDQIVTNASGRSARAIPIDEAFFAVDAAYRSLDELFVSALETTRGNLNSDINTAEQLKLVATVLTPLLLLILIGIGLAIHRSGRKREEAMERERNLLDSRNRFMRMVSHELRTPATAISGFTQMLTTEWTSLTETEITEFLSIVDRQSTHLTLIVDDLLTLSHLETGRLRLHLGAVNLTQAASEAVAMVDARYGIEVAMSIDPDVVLLADPDRLVQILRNLVENAAKYGKTGVAVTAAKVDEACEIIVSDTGPGVPPEAADRIFRFWDRGGRDDDLTRGHGMGLAIARHLARAMVGDLRYRPHQPMGSEFVLTLPVASTPEPTIDAKPDSAELLAG